MGLKEEEEYICGERSGTMTCRLFTYRDILDNLKVIFCSHSRIALSSYFFFYGCGGTYLWPPT